MTKRIELMTGAVFADSPDSFPKQIAELNAKYDNSVTELYSSLRSSQYALPTARPDFRLRDVDIVYLEKYVRACNDNDIAFNYTANAPMFGDLAEISAKYDSIVTYLKRLEDIGVKRITIANPILLQIVCENSKLDVELSTILNVTQPSGLIKLKSMYPNINKVCIGIDINRSINLVNNLVNTGLWLGIDVEVMASEFCKVGRSNCSQIHRSTCYQMHSYNMSEQTAKYGINPDGSKQQREVRGYPWGNVSGCIFNRSNDSIPWLVSNTIWPNELREYSDLTNVSHFKITTRTAPPEYALFLTEQYLKESYNGPLAGLWLQLQASSSYAKGGTDFSKLQNNHEQIVSYNCGQLSEPRMINAKLGMQSISGEAKFFDLYFENPSVDFSNITYDDFVQDKFTTNWADVWHKLLT